MNQRQFDVIFAGGGLAAVLSAYRLRQLRPELRLLVLEAGEKLGGNHTWSFHDSDISNEARKWVEPFIARSWPKQTVQFPKYSRSLSIGYNTIFSQSLHAAALGLLRDSVVFSAKAASISPFSVQMENGQVYSAPCVIDARGPNPDPRLATGYQKFVGVVARFKAPHGQSFPIIMDATVAQLEGYRFVYTLPLAADEMLIEDTYYSDGPELDVRRLRENCLDYCTMRGWKIAEVVREERGILPVVLSGSPNAFSPGNETVAPAIGLRAGFFHHTTSYSFPFAVRYAEAIAALRPLTSEKLKGATEAWIRSHWREQRFFRLLNRMLFWAAKPDQRYRILERFYELGEPLIQRFYSSTLTRADKARILMGWPPVPIGRALRVLYETPVNPMAEATPWIR